MTTQIVTVDVSLTNAPAPSTLQSTGALISQGATSTAEATRSLLTEFSDLTAILAGAKAISTITWTLGVATVTTAAPHGYTVTEVIELTIAGVTPSGYNGTYACTITGASTFTYALASNPGSETVPGTYTPEDVAELVAMATTFFAQGANQSVYVLELGEGDSADGVTALGTYISANPGFFYSYLTPRDWGGEATFPAFVNTFAAPTAKTYFFITATDEQYSAFATYKAAYVEIEAPGIPSTEFTLAATFFVTLAYSPSPVNKVPPLNYAFVFGVTPYPTPGNQALFATLKAAFVNIIGTGAEGGLSNTIVFYGTTMDGKPFGYWYSVDWVQVNVALALANAIINGSNNTQNPLYYNQDGINRLRAVAQQVMNNGIAIGLVLGPAIVNAVSFAAYTAANPSDFANGIYNGLSVSYTPSRGFISITFFVNVTSFPTA